MSGHEDWVNSAAFSPDGTRIVTASEDRPRACGTQCRRDAGQGTSGGGLPPPLVGLSIRTRDEMRLAGYPDSEPLIDVCAGVAEARP